MPEPADFVPFIPRRVGVAAVPVEDPQPSVVEEPVREAPADAVVEPQPEGQPVESLQFADGAAGDVAEPPAQESASAESEVCNHRLEIREQAIRLAAIACGRALRHAVALHPQVLASFVDDAIAAAGHPEHARVRVASEAVAAVADRGYECIADSTLPCGAVVVECSGTSVKATLDDRAELLARWAADR